MKDLDIDIKRINHSCTHLRYHIVLVCKYRRKLLNDDVCMLLSGIFNDIASHSHFTIKHIGFDRDHVHLFVKSVPSFSVLDIVRRLKQVSTRRLWRERPEYLKRFFWKGRPLWTSGYYCSTVGAITEDSVIRYIENQGNSPAKLKI
jgi:putative transposase